MYPYLPSLFSIYVLLIAPVVRWYLKGLVDQLDGETWNPPMKDFLRNAAEDWETRSGFLNATVAALVSVFVTFAQYVQYAVVAALLFIAITIPVGIWILSHTTIGDLVKKPTKPVSIRGREVNKSADTICRFILIAMNVILLVLVYISESWSAAG
jgi:hypothetical protein